MRLIASLLALVLAVQTPALACAPEYEPEPPPPLYPIQELFDGTTEPYLALVAYAGWLDSADPKDPQARAVLAEADETYNWLVGWDREHSSFWRRALKDDPVVRTIRRAGRAIRAR